MKYEDEMVTKMANECIKKGRFRLRSGAISEYYIDKYLMQANHRILAYCVDRIATYDTTRNVSNVAGIEMGSIPLASCITYQTGIPLCIVRMRDFGVGKNLIEGQLGSHVMLIEDVVTSGGTTLEACRRILNGSYGESKVVKVRAIVDRGGLQRVKDEGYDIKAIWRFEDEKLVLNEV